MGDTNKQIEEFLGALATAAFDEVLDTLKKQLEKSAEVKVRKDALAFAISHSSGDSHADVKRAETYAKFLATGDVPSE